MVWLVWMVHKALYTSIYCCTLGKCGSIEILDTNGTHTCLTPISNSNFVQVVHLNNLVHSAHANVHRTLQAARPAFASLLHSGRLHDNSYLLLSLVGHILLTFLTLAHSPWGQYAWCAKIPKHFRGCCVSHFDLRWFIKRLYLRFVLTPPPIPYIRRQQSQQIRTQYRGKYSASVCVSSSPGKR